MKASTSWAEKKKKKTKTNSHVKNPQIHRTDKHHYSLYEDFVEIFSFFLIDNLIQMDALRFTCVHGKGQTGSKVHNSTVVYMLELSDRPVPHILPLPPKSYIPHFPQRDFIMVTPIFYTESLLNFIIQYICQDAVLGGTAGWTARAHHFTCTSFPSCNHLQSPRST